MASIADLFANPDLLKTYGGQDGAEYYNPFNPSQMSAGYKNMFDQGYTLAQDPNIWGTFKEGNFQTDPSQVVYDPTTNMKFYPGEDIGGAWNKVDTKDQGWGNPMTAATILALSLGATAPFWGAGLASGAAGGAAEGAAAAETAAAGELSAIGPAQGSILAPGLQASGAMTFPVANPYLGIEMLGAGGAGGAMANELAFSDIGPAQGQILGPGIQESGAITYPVTANPYAGITATPTGSLWDTAKDLLSKKPSLPPGLGGGGQTGGSGGEGGDEQMNLWSGFASPHPFDPVRAYQPSYLNIPKAAYPFEAELQRRLALIKGAQ